MIIPFAAAPSVLSSALNPQATQADQKILPWEPAATLTIQIRCLCYDSKRFQTSKTSQSKMSDSASQPSSRAAKSGKFTLFSRAIKHSGIQLEVLSLQNRESFEHFVCFQRNLGISPQDLGGFKADIAFIYSAFVCSLTMSTNLILILTFFNAKFDWFVIRCAF